MDLLKIGKYIAGKRKEQGLTQRYLRQNRFFSDIQQTRSLRH
jgi:hypothetical protein